MADKPSQNKAAAPAEEGMERVPREGTRLRSDRPLTPDEIAAREEVRLEANAKATDLHAPASEEPGEGYTPVESDEERDAVAGA